MSDYFSSFFEVETPHITDKYGEFLSSYHTIPNDDRELQLHQDWYPKNIIIPYQMMTGNYSVNRSGVDYAVIIPYQMMTGNYSQFGQYGIPFSSYHTK